MSVSYWQEPGTTDRRPSQAQVVIIGAGVIGAYLALRLAEEGSRPTLIEARYIAGGASGRNAGMVLSGIADNYYRAIQHYGRAEARQLWTITLHNRAIMWELSQRLGVPAERQGSMVLATDPEEAEELREAAALLHEDGFTCEFLADDPLGRGFSAALHTPDDFVINPARLVHALLQASTAQVYEGHEVYALKSHENGVLVRARGLDLLAETVILATNAYTALLEPTLAEVIIPQRNQVLVTAPHPPVLSVACYANRGFEYFRQLSDGRLLIGGCRNRCLEEEQTFANAITPRIQEALEALLARYFPDIKAPIERRWSGTMGFTPDGLPLIGQLRCDERISIVAGFNGHGLGLGVVTAEMLLALLRGNKQSDADFFAGHRLLPQVF